jgi:hypothetical protein
MNECGRAVPGSATTPAAEDPSTATIAVVRLDGQ